MGARLFWPCLNAWYGMDLELDEKNRAQVVLNQTIYEQELKAGAFKELKNGTGVIFGLKDGKRQVLRTIPKEADIQLTTMMTAAKPGDYLAFYWEPEK